MSISEKHIEPRIPPHFFEPWKNEQRTDRREIEASFASSSRFALSQGIRYAAHVVADYREVYVKGKGSSIEDNDRLSAPMNYRPLVDRSIRGNGELR